MASLIAGQQPIYTKGKGSKARTAARRFGFSAERSGRSAPSKVAVLLGATSPDASPQPLGRSAAATATDRGDY
jgi:hypothetical protein